MDLELWCGRRDLNPHDLRHGNLNPARLPVPPRPPDGRGGQDRQTEEKSLRQDPSDREKPGEIRARVYSTKPPGTMIIRRLFRGWRALSPKPNPGPRIGN